MGGAHGSPRGGQRQGIVIQNSITLTINGRERQVQAEISLPGLLTELGVDRRLVAVAHNGEVIPRATYDDITLQNGDRVEVVRMVGGG
jgi:thiamine biosynthesis protein ThiS